MERQNAALEPQIEGYRLSPQQKHLWVLQQEDHSQAYVAQCSVLIEGPLQFPTLECAIQRVVRRHEILRTTFRRLPGMAFPIQVIQTEPADVTITDYDLSHLEPQEQQAFIRTLSYEVRQQDFLYEREALLRISLLMLAQNRYILLLTLPALCADTAGLENIVREISVCYTACASRTLLQEVELQYADLAEWQNETLESEEEEARIGKDYWRHHNVRGPRDLQLPGEQVTASCRPFAPNLLAVELDPQVKASIDALVKHYDTSYAAFFLACWCILLSRLSEKHIDTVAVLNSGRNYRELYEIPGLFAKFLPLQFSLHETTCFKDFLKQIEQTWCDMAVQQEYFCWEAQVDDSSPAFFPLCFEFQETPATFSAADLAFSSRERNACISRFSLKLCCVPGPETIKIEQHFDANTFSPETVQRQLSELLTVLEGAALHPEQAICNLEIVSQDERRLLLDVFNQSELPYSSDACIHHLISLQAERTPDAVAVTFEDQQQTYRDLVKQANQMAHYLQKAGVRPEVPVGICLRRSSYLVSSILAILQAGGVFVPLDPSYPPERLAYIVNDARIPIIVTETQVSDLFSTCNTRTVNIDTERETIAGQSDTVPHTTVTPDHLAYVIYTSGSTGSPKGVMIEHRSLVNYISWVNDRLLGETVQWIPLVTRLNFDASLKQLFSPLLRGGSVWILPEQTATSPLALLENLSRREQVALNCVPSLWDTLLTLLSTRQVVLPTTSLSRLLLGGEAVSRELVERSFALFPHVRIDNLYGPTETTANASSAEVCDQGEITLGRPIANTQIYLLDSHLQPVPLGMTGILYVGGPGLARGYLHHPDITAKSFLPHPFSRESGARLYCTGDLARYLPDGRIEYLGRIDHQVKIRGFRIELTEIETVCCQYQAVRSAVALAREDRSGEKRLVVYVVPDTEQQVSPSALREYLAAHLPDYMIPAAIVVIAHLPLMPNGKVDRHALPDPEQANRALREKTYVAPRTQLETKIAAIWAEILGVEQVGIYDDFTELGGHSLLIMKVGARLREEFHKEIPLRTVLEAKTVASLARVMEQLHIVEMV